MAGAVAFFPHTHATLPFPPPLPPTLPTCPKHVHLPTSTTSHGTQTCCLFSSRHSKPIHHESPSSLSSALEKCAASRSLREGARVHARLIRLGLLTCDNPELLHHLLLLYSSAGRPAAAAAILLLTPSDILTPFFFNTVIRNLVAESLPDTSVKLFLAMLAAGVRPNEFTFPFVLRSATLLGLFSLGQQLHVQILKSELLHNVFCATALLDLYTKLAPLADAHQVFVTIPKRTEATWNSMISALVEDGFVEDGFQMLEMMENDGIEAGASSWNSLLAGSVRSANTGLALQILGDMASLSTVSLNAATFNTILPVIPKIPSLNWLKTFHGFALRKTETTKMTPIDKDRLLAAMTDGYCFHGSMDYACRLFEDVSRKSPHLWICILSGFLDCKRTQEAFKAFREMSARCVNEGQTLSRTSLSLVLPECGQIPKNGLEIHAYAIRKGLDSNASVGNALMAMYSKMRDMLSTHKVFQRIIEKDIVSWNTMIASYAAVNEFDQAFELFRHMLVEEFEPDEYTFSSILNGSVHSSRLRNAITLHGRLIKNGIFQSFLVVQNALMDVYGKCGSTEDARKVFDDMGSCDVISWNTIISCYGFSGRPREAISMFEGMKSEGLKPNRVTFIALLSACSHAGMLDLGLDYFKSMPTQHGLVPDVGHYACMVDNMGRMGELDRAYQFIKDMPIAPDDCIWSALLSSCRIHGNLELAEVAAKNLIELKPQHSGYWVLLSNIYSDASRWDDVANVRAAMKDSGVKKCPGYSWVEIVNNSEVHRFLTADKSHKNCSDIYLVLEGLTLQLKDEGYVPCADSKFSSLIGHSLRNG